MNSNLIANPFPSRGHSRSELLTLIVVMVFPTIITYIYFVRLVDAPAELQQTVFGVLKAIQFALPVCWALRFAKPLGFLLPTQRGLVPALTFGTVSALALVLLHARLLAWMGDLGTAQQAVHAKIQQMGFVTRPKYIALAAFYTMAHSLLEEYYWRWCVFGGLRGFVKDGTAIVLSSLAFTAHHVIVLTHFFGWNSPTAWLASAGVVLAGAIWAWLYARTGYLFPGWISHAVIDAAIFFVGYLFVFG